MAFMLPLVLGAAALGINAKTIIDRKARKEAEGRNTYLDQQIGQANALPSVTNIGVPSNASIEQQLTAAGYRPGTPDFEAAKAAGLAAIEQKRQALQRSGGGPGVTPARRTSPELEFYRRSLDERLAASQAATERGFGQVVSEIQGRQAGIDPEAAAAAARAAFLNAATETAASNAAAAEMIAGGQGQGIVGVGPVEGSAAAAPAYLMSSGATSADTARRLSQLSAEDLAWLASTTSGVSSARSGELRQETSRLQAEAMQRFLESEAERVQRERAAAASAAASRERALIDLAGAEQAFLADLYMKEAETKADAERRWLEATMPYEAERIASQPQVPAFSPGDVSYSFYTAARSGKTAFTQEFDLMRQAYGRDFDRWLTSQGFPISADAAWKEINKRSQSGR